MGRMLQQWLSHQPVQRMDGQLVYNDSEMGQMLQQWLSRRPVQQMDGQLAYNGFGIGRMLQQLECLVQRLRDGIASSIQRNRTAGATFDSVLEEHWLQDGNTSNYHTLLHRICSIWWYRRKQGWLEVWS